MPYNYLIRIDKKYNLQPEELAPLTDAGLTPYRGVKKLRAAGVLGPDRVVYAKLFSAGAAAVVFARSDEKLAVAKDNGADVAINTRGKSLDDIRNELFKGTGHREIDGIVDCVGAEEGIRMGFNQLATSGAYTAVGLVGDRIDIPLFPLVGREFTFHGSFWGNYTDLSEVIALAQERKLRHSLGRIRLDDVK
jgi:propanol-preferring alcohol dehydrogenase